MERGRERENEARRDLSFPFTESLSLRYCTLNESLLLPMPSLTRLRNVSLEVARVQTQLVELRLVKVPARGAETNFHLFPRLKRVSLPERRFDCAIPPGYSSLLSFFLSLSLLSLSFSVSFCLSVSLSLSLV